MLEFFNWVMTVFLNTPVQIIVLILGATGVSLLSQVLKKWWSVENERWVFLLVTGIALAGSVLDWLLSSSNLPPTVIGVQTTFLVGIAQPIYFYAIKPLNMVIAGYRSNKDAIEAKLAEVEVAKVPSQINTLEDAEKVVSAIKEVIPTIPMTQTAPASVPKPVQGAIAPIEHIEAPRPVATF